MISAAAFLRQSNEVNDARCKIISEIIDEASKKGKYFIDVDVKTVDLDEEKQRYLGTLGYKLHCLETGKRYRIGW